MLCQPILASVPGTGYMCDGEERDNAEDRSEICCNNEGEMLKVWRTE